MYNLLFMRALILIALVALTFAAVASHSAATKGAVKPAAKVGAGKTAAKAPLIKSQKIVLQRGRKNTVNFAAGAYNPKKKAGVITKAPTKFNFRYGFNNLPSFMSPFTNPVYGYPTGFSGKCPLTDNGWNNDLLSVLYNNLLGYSGNQLFNLLAGGTGYPLYGLGGIAGVLSGLLNPTAGDFYEPPSTTAQTVLCPFLNNQRYIPKSVVIVVPANATKGLNGTLASTIEPSSIVVGAPGSGWGQETTTTTSGSTSGQAGALSGQSTGQYTGQYTGQTTGQASGQATGGQSTGGQSSGQYTGQTSGQTSGQTYGQTSGQVTSSQTPVGGQTTFSGQTTVSGQVPAQGVAAQTSSGQGQVSTSAGGQASASGQTAYSGQAPAQASAGGQTGTTSYGY